MQLESWWGLLAGHIVCASLQMQEAVLLLVLLIAAEACFCCWNVNGTAMPQAGA